MTNDSCIEVTEDHSLYDSNRKEIKPSSINNETQLEYYSNEIKGNIIFVDDKFIKLSANMFNNGKFDRFDYKLLNMNIDKTKYLLSLIKAEPQTKVAMAQIQYLNNKILSFDK